MSDCVCWYSMIMFTLTAIENMNRASIMYKDDRSVLTSSQLNHTLRVGGSRSIDNEPPVINTAALLPNRRVALCQYIRNNQPCISNNSQPPEGELGSALSCTNHATDTDTDKLENSDVLDHKCSPTLESSTWYTLFRDANSCPITGTT